MRLLLDANLSPSMVDPLERAGYTTVHVVELGLLTATDEEIFDRAVDEDFVVVTADSDFGTLLAQRRAMSPSVIHLRGVAELTRERHVELLATNLPQILHDLERGVIVSMGPRRLAVRDLPIR